MTQRGEGALDWGTMTDAPLKGLAPILVTAALTLSACGGGAHRAPVEEVSTAGAETPGASSMGPPAAGAEVSDGDWTAKVRALGESGTTRSRALPGSEPLEPAQPSAAAPPAAKAAPPAPAPASGGTGGAVNPAVVSLLNAASAQSRAGDYTRAAATLERAIAIEPDNAWLWHRLAETRLAEGRLEQAASLASKSNTLASADRRLQADNWNLIAEVRRRQGDAAGAAAAASQARALAN